MFNLKNLITKPYKYRFKILNKISPNSGRVDYIQIVPSGETINFESDAARGLNYFQLLKKNDILNLGPNARVFVFDFLTCLYSSGCTVNKPHLFSIVKVLGTLMNCRTEKIKVLEIFDPDVFYQELFKLVKKEFQKLDVNSRKFLQINSLIGYYKKDQNHRVVGVMYRCLYELLTAPDEKLKEHNEILLKLLAQCFPEIFEYV